MRSETSIELKGIGAVIREERLAVPLHQRSFEWRATEVQELLDDLHGAFQRDEEYFLGSIVLIAGEEKQVPSVIDGQQRLATIALLLAGIADQFARVGDTKRASEMRAQYLTRFDIAAGETEAQLRLNRLDEPYFRTLLESDIAPPSPGAPDSHALLHDARTRIADWLSAEMCGGPDPVRSLAQFTTYLTQSARVIVVNVPDDANAFLIFETLNDRGLDLSIADLLKNYLLGRAADDLDVVLTHWTNALASLRAYGGENVFTVFLRHLWSSQYDVVREKDLYRDIKARIVSQPTVVTFSDELEQHSYLYAAILSAEHEHWATATAETRTAIRTLDLLGLEQYRPLLLAALAHLAMPEVEKLLRLLINWNVRLLIVGGLGGGVMERHYSELARAIRGGHLKGASDIADSAASFVPGDTAFREAFATARVSKVTLARYYLRTLDENEGGQDRSERIPSPTLTLEHVLPQRPSGNWPQFSPEEAAAFRNRLGNMVLLTERMNTKLRSSPFPDKREVYGRSELLFTTELADSDEWTIKSIEERQRRLADSAVRAWPLA